MESTTVEDVKRVDDVIFLLTDLGSIFVVSLVSLLAVLIFGTVFACVYIISGLKNTRKRKGGGR